MWIEIKKDVFESGNENDLATLINLLAYNPVDSVFRYNIFIDLNRVENVTGFKKLSASLQELVREEYNAFAFNPQKIRYVISLKDKGSNVFNIEESIRFFMQPLFIIVENNKNDPQFIECLIYHFGKKNANGKKILVEHLENGWLDFDNAGGCGNVKNFITGKLRKYRDMALKHQRPDNEYYRCFVILDGDKEHPDRPIKHDYLLLIDYLRGIGSNNFHILEKRMMENYMPDEVIHSFANKKVLRSWVEVYKKLSPTQKDFLNYNTGFAKIINKGVRKPMEADIVKLYPLLPDEIKVLDEGLKYPDFKNSFPLLFTNSPLVNKFTLNNRTKTAELDQIIDKIGALL